MTKKFDEKNITNKPIDEDDDQNFIRKDEPVEEKSETKEGEEAQGIIQKLKNLFFPKNNQQRNLTLETGGLEAKKDKGISLADVWDGRSEEVDKMTSTNVFETSGMRSIVWKKKRERLALKAAEIGTALKSQDAPTQPTKSYVSRLKNLQQDRSEIHDDGVSR